VGFAIGAVEALGHVEDEVGPGLAETRVGLFVGLEHQDIVPSAESGRDGGDGLIRVTFGEDVARWRLVVLDDDARFVQAAVKGGGHSGLGAEEQGDLHHRSSELRLRSRKVPLSVIISGDLFNVNVVSHSVLHVHI
jgi:hypothetical protein